MFQISIPEHILPFSLVFFVKKVPHIDSFFVWKYNPFQVLIHHALLGNCLKHKKTMLCVSYNTKKFRNQRSFKDLCIGFGHVIATLVILVVVLKYMHVIFIYFIY